MAVKTITITTSAYEKLKRMKGVDESFSDVILRIGSGKKSIKDFVGLLKDSGEPAEALQKRVGEIRKRASGSVRGRRDNLGHIGHN